jgi:hypothetical protein
MNKPHKRLDDHASESDDPDLRFRSRLTALFNVASSFKAVDIRSASSVNTTRILVASSKHYSSVCA